MRPTLNHFALYVEGGEEVGLVQLRKLLQDAGLRDLGREATYSIERARTSKKSNFSGTKNDEERERQDPTH